MSNLYLVATPIGNLEDISQRAINVLRAVDWIAAEDTRHTGKLLKHFNIQTSLISFHEHSKHGKLMQILDLLEQGDIALVSDAGTPVISDPGYELVQRALAAGHQVSPIPGPSAPISALIASGLPADKFLFLGYLPRKSSERRNALQEIADLPYTLIFFETPHRLQDALKDLLEELGERQLAVGREISKLHEEFFRGSTSAAIEHYTTTPARGEITLIVAGKTGDQAPWPEEEVISAIEQQKAAGIPPARIASQLALQSNWPRRRIYQLIIDME